MRKENSRCCSWGWGRVVGGGEGVRTGEGCKASKSARSRPSGSDGGHARTRFGVDSFSRFVISLSPSSSASLRLLFLTLCGSTGRCALTAFARCAVVSFGGASSMGLRSLVGADMGVTGSAVRKDWSAQQVVRMLEVMGDVGCDGGGESRRKGGK